MNEERLSRRRFLRLAGMVGAGAVLGACAPPTPAVAPQAAPAAPAAPTAQPVAKMVSLKLLTPDIGAGQQEWMEGELFPAFIKANPTVEKIEIIGSDWGKINEQLMAGYAAGDAADIFEHGSAASGASWAASGKTLALDEFFKTLTTQGDYYEVGLKTAYYQGKLFSMPRYVQIPTLCYRKDYFKEAGLDPTKPPTTWEELSDMAKKLVKKDGDKYVRSGYNVPTKSWDGVQAGWFPFLHQNGSQILTDDLTKVAFDSPAGIEAMQYYHDLLWVHKVDVLGGLPSTIAGNAVAVGTSAMGQADSSVIPILKKNFPEVMPNFGVAPTTKRVRLGTMLGTGRTFISNTTKAPQEAWKLLAFMHTMDNMTARYKLAGTIPPLKSFSNTEAAKSEPLIPEFLKQVENGFQWPPTGKWNDFRSMITSMSDGFLAQDGKVDEFVKNAAKDINAILAKA
jgi:multiple sugar transport system substrate-binding protein